MTARTDRGSATATTVGRPFPQAIEVAGLERSFGGVVVLAGVDLELGFFSRHRHVQLHRQLTESV